MLNSSLSIDAFWITKLGEDNSSRKTVNKIKQYF